MNGTLSHLKFLEFIGTPKLQPHAFLPPVPFAPSLPVNEHREQPLKAMGLLAFGCANSAPRPLFGGDPGRCVSGLKTSFPSQPVR